MVDELEGMIIERLLAYEKKTSKLPQRVFIFRDGVSEVCALDTRDIIIFAETLTQRDSSISR